jgi:tetratricopeptide (TPR) repeat protein
MTRSQELIASLKESPRDEGKLEALVRWFSRKGEWDALYESLTELVTASEEIDLIEWYRAHLAAVLQRHVDTEQDPTLGGALRLRLANLLSEHLGQREEAVILIAQAFERYPSPRILDRAMTMLEQLGELRFAARLLQAKAAGEDDPDRAADLWLRLAYALRTLGELARALDAFRHAATYDNAPGKTAAKEVERVEALVARATKALDEARKEDAGDPESKVRLGRMILSLEPGSVEGGDLLLEAFLAEPTRSDLVPYLLDALSEAGRWEDLLEVLRARFDVAGDDAERAELLVERFRIRLLHQNDRAGAEGLLEQIHQVAPGARHVVRAIADAWAELQEWEKIFLLYERARKQAGHREEERYFLEAEAVLVWKRIDDRGRAEKLFRRIRSIDPKNSTCLRFYEEYYEEEEDWRKLFTTLSTRQTLSPDSEKRSILLRMAALADERIGSPDRAIDALKKVLMIEPTNDEAAERLQALYQREGKWHALVDFLDAQVSKIDDDKVADKSALLWRIHGIYSAPDKQPIPEMELSTLKRIVQTDPGDVKALGLLSERYRDSRRWSALAETVQGLADHTPDLEEKRALLGELAGLYSGRLRNQRKATEALEAILELDPDDAEALSTLAEIYRGRGMTEKLYGVLQFRLKAARGTARKELLEELAHIALDRLKRPEEGVEYLEKHVAIDPKAEATWTRLQQVYGQLGRWETLAELLERRLEETERKQDRISLMETLGEILLDHLEDAPRARSVYRDLLELNPRSRAGRENLRRLFVLERDWDALRELFAEGEEWSAYLQFLEESWRRAETPDLIRDVGWELTRGAEELLDDAERGLGYLAQMLERLPEDLDVARGLLERDDECPDETRAAALAVLADVGEGADAEAAAADLADLLEEMGEAQGAHARTLALLATRLGRGETELLDLAVDRADAADALSELLDVVEGLLAGLDDRGVAEAVTVRLASVYRERLRDLDGATRLLTAAREEDPGAFPILEALERTYLAAGKMEPLDEILGFLVDAAPTEDVRRAKLLTRARLHEDVLAEPERAYEDYRQLVELDGTDLEGYQGMIRALEQQGDTAGLVAVLEELLVVHEEADEQRALMQRIARLTWAELGDGAVASEWCRRILDAVPGDKDAVRLARDIFDAGEAATLLIPLLRSHYEETEAWADLVDVLTAEAGLTEDSEARYALLLETADLLEQRLERHDEAYEACLRALGIRADAAGLRERTEALAEKVDALASFSELLAGLAGIEGYDAPVEIPLEDDEIRAICGRLATLAEEKLGDDALAITALQRSLEVDPDQLEDMQRLAPLLRRTSRWDALLELLKEKEKLVFEETERKDCHLELAALLTDQMDDPAGAIEWLEAALIIDEEDRAVADRLEEAYTGHERWTDLVSLLRSRLGYLEGEERNAVAFQLAMVLKDQVEDLGGAVEILQGLLEVDGADRDAVVGALEGVLLVTTAAEYETVASRVATLITPILEDAAEWARLALVLEAHARVTEDPADAARHWMSLAAVREDHLSDPGGAFDATAEAVRLDPDSRDVVEALQIRAGSTGRDDALVSLLREAVGDVETAQSLWALGVLTDALQSRGEEPRTVASLLERLVELEPRAIGYHRRLADTYETLNRPDDRIRVLEAMVGVMEDLEDQADVLVLLGELLIAQDRPADAVDVLRRVTSRVSALSADRDKHAFAMVEELLEAEENWFDLEELLRRKAEISEEDAEKIAALYRAAVIQEESLDNADSAIEYYQLIRELEPREDGASDNLERLLQATGRFGDLAELYRSRLEIHDEWPRKREDLYRLSVVLVDQLGQAEEGLAQISRLLEKEPEHKGAVELLKRLVEDHPAVAYQATVLLETHHELVEDWQGLAEVYSTQIDRYPDEISVVEKYRDLAELYDGRLADVDGAFMYMAQAFRLEPGSEAIHDRLLGYAETRGAWDELFDIYLDVLVELDSAEERNILRRKMARLFHDTLEDLERAEMLYRDILDDEPKDVFAHERLSALYRAAEDWEKLVDVLRQAEAVADGKGARIRLLFEISGICSENLSAPGDALDALESVLALDPKQWDAYRSIESIHFAEGDTEGAIAVIRRELEVTEGAAERGAVRLRLAQLLALEAGNVAGALDQLEEARAEGAVAEGVLEFLDDLRGHLDAVSDRYVELVTALHREAGALDPVIAVYQWAAGMSEDPVARSGWFDRIYKVRTEDQDNDQGAYAVTKIMVQMEPGRAELRERLFFHAEAANEEPDLADYLNSLVERDDVDEALRVVLRGDLARLLQERLERPEDAATHWEALRGEADAADAARAALVGIYRDLERWGPYAEVLREDAENRLDEPVAAREALLEAARVLTDPLERLEDAAAVYRQIVDLVPDDEEVLDRFEELLLRLESAEDLEGLLRHRIDVAADPEIRGEIRLRLAGVLLDGTDRLAEGVVELQGILSEQAGHEGAMVQLEALLGVEGMEEDLLREVGQTLLEQLPGDAETSRLTRVLAVLLQVAEGPDEELELHGRFAAALQAAGERDGALYHWGRVLVLDPGSEEAAATVESLATALEDWQGLRDIYQQAADAGGDSLLEVRYLLKAAELTEVQLDAADEAAPLYRRVLDLDSLSLGALDALERYHRGRDEPAELAEILENKAAAVEGPDRAEVGMELAGLYLDHLARTDRAVEWYRDLLSNPDFGVDAFERLAAIHQTAQDWDALHDLLMDRLAGVDDDDTRQGLLARCAAVEEQFLEAWDDAVARYREILDLDGDSLFAWNGLRRCYRRLELLADLAEVDTQLLERVDEDERLDLQRELADLYVGGLDDPARGLAMIEAVLDADPEDGGARALAEDLLGRGGQYAFEAAGILEPFATRDGDWAALAELLTTRFEHLDVPGERAGVARKIAGVLAEHLDDKDEAILWYGRALDALPEDAEAFESLERLLDAEGRYEDVADLYERRLGLIDDPALRSAMQLKLGFLREARLDDKAGALDAYREILAVDPDHEAAMTRIDAMLDDPVYGFGAAEILEPIYREEKFRDRLPRLLLAKLGEVEGGFERAQVLTEAARSKMAADGDPGEVFDLLLRAVGEGSFDAETVLTPAGQLAEELGRWPDLADALERAAERTDDDDTLVDLLRRLALILDQKVGSPARAEAKLRALLDVDPDDGFALTQLARIVEESGQNREELLALLDRMAGVAETPAVRRNALLRIADNAALGDFVDQELDALRRILDQDPEDPEVLDRLEARCRALEDWSALVEVLERRVQQTHGEEGIPVRLDLAQVFANKLDDRGRSIGVLENVVSLWPANWDAVRALVGQLALDQDWFRVVGVLRDFSAQEGPAKGDRLDRLWEAHGVARERLGDAEIAMEVVEQILALDPDNGRALDERIALMEGGGDVDQVVAAIDRKIEDTDDPQEKAELLVKTARSLLGGGGGADDAIRRLELAVEHAPDYVLARRTLLGVHLERGDFGAAVEGYEALADIDPESRGDSLRAAGRIWLEQLDDPTRAALVLSRVREEGLGDRTTAKMLDTALRRAHRWEDVITMLEAELEGVDKPKARADLCRSIAEAWRDGLDDHGEYLRWIEEAHKAKEDPKIVDELLEHYDDAGDAGRVADLLQWKIDHLSKKRRMRNLPALLVRLGGLLEVQGRAAEALAAYKRCEEVDASYMPNQLAYARALMVAEDTDAAFKVYQMLTMRINELEETTQKVEVFFNLARLSLGQGNKTKAKQYLNRLLSIDKAYKPALELLDEIS